MKRMSFLFVTLVFQAMAMAQDYRNPAVTNVTTPPSAAGRSVTTPPSTYGRHTIPSRISEADFRNRNRVFGYYDGTSLYGGDSLFNIPRYEGYDPIQDSLPLSGFLRRTTTSDYGYRSTRQTQPYYIPPQTTAYVTRDYQEAYVPKAPAFRSSLNDVLERQYYQGTGTERPDTYFSQDYYDATSPLRRPLSLTPERMREIIDERLREQTPTDEELLTEEETQETEKAQEPEYRHALEDLVPRPVEPIKPDEMTEQERLKKEIEEKLLDDTLREEEKKESPLKTLEPGLEQTMQETEQMLEENEQAREQAEESDRPGGINLKPEIPEREPIEEADHKKAKEIRGDKTFDEYVESKFSQYIKAGHDFMQNKEYYKAADAFLIADYFKPNQVEAVLGRSHALLGAGEYMSAGYYLQRAVSMDKDKALARKDLVEILGSRDVYDTRVADLSQWTQRSQAPELGFLLSYVLLMADKYDNALTAIQLPEKFMQDAPEVKELRKAIEDAKAKSPW